MPSCFSHTPTALTALLAAGVLVTGCHRAPGQGVVGQPPSPAVTVTTLQPVDVVEFDEVTARLEAREIVEIRPRVSGYLTEVHLQPGAMVKRGDLLFVIDPRPKQAVFDRAEAEVKRARVRLEITGREERRADLLFETKAISIEEADQRRWAHTDAEAALQAAESVQETARLDLEYCHLKSPIDGRVGRALVTAGNNVSGVDGFTTLLATVVSVNPIYAYSDVDESTLRKFRRLTKAGRFETNAAGKVKVEMALSGEPTFPHQGFIESMDNRLDSGTGSILVRTEYPNPDGTLLPGLFARVRLPGSAREPALLVNESAIGTDQSQRFVLVLTSSNSVAYRPVKLGGSVGGKRIVRQGLQAGETIVVNGLMRVQPGMTVTPQPERAAVAAAERP